MNKLKKGCLVLSVLLMGSLSINAYCTEHWDKFLLQPDKDTFVELEKTLTGSSPRCDQAIAPERRHRAQLFELINDGNPYAFRAGILVSRCWGVADSEDFHRSAGVFFETCPLAFMQIVNKNAIPDVELEYMFSMLPSEAADNIDLSLSIVDRRIEILKGIREKSFDHIKNIGVINLEEFKKDILRIKIELEKSQ